MANKATHMDAGDVKEEKNDFMVRIVNVMKREAKPRCEIRTTWGKFDGLTKTQTHELDFFDQPGLVPGSSSRSMAALAFRVRPRQTRS